MKASHLLHAAVQGAHPCDAYGVPIPFRGAGGSCAGCGQPGAYRLADAISDNFTTVKNDSRAWPFGDGDLCAACMFAARTLALRCSGWFATRDEVSFFPTWTAAEGAPRPDVLTRLFDPPDPPFVAAYPSTGIAHGGDRHVHRAWWPGRPMDSRPLIRLQSKHVAIYARVAMSRDRYPMQIDDQHDVVVDVQQWRHFKNICDDLLIEMRHDGLGARECIDSLDSLRPPLRASVRLVRDWSYRVKSLRPHANAPWWFFFTQWLHVPPLPKEKVHATSRY